MQTPQETSGTDIGMWAAVFAGLIYILKRWGKHLDPRMILVWLNAPTMRPVHAKLDRICRVIDKMPGADAAHEAVRQEDSKQRYNWEQP